MRTRELKTRPAFTLIELLVVIAVTSLLLALSVPAVQQGREAARRTQCRNHLKQISLALHNYHDTHGKLPSPAYCGVPGSSTIQHCHTWIETLLPFIDEQNKHAAINFNVSNHRGVNPSVLNNWQPALLKCPSDPDSGLFPNSRETDYTPGAGESLGANYIPCAGPLHMNSCPIPARSPNINCLGNGGARLNEDAPGMFAGGWRAYRFSECTDGLSNTFLIGETLPIYSTFQMYFASHLHIGTNNPPPNYHKIHTACPPSRTTRIGTCYAAMGGFKSTHAGGVQMALADGSVRLINEAIDYPTWCYVGNKSDGQPLAEF
ncbi:DUF1559 family PulG-like putative transporter [Planctomicrobium sp. SH664]|uniref:DUF1559 family PulG-like putative transporter n=1 Tax=Planctomicrobium sp. SH664 TaxID=3448125 RepID=UPI003F5C286E